MLCKWLCSTPNGRLIIRLVNPVAAPQTRYNTPTSTRRNLSTMEHYTECNLSRDVYPALLSPSELMLGGSAEAGGMSARDLYTLGPVLSLCSDVWINVWNAPCDGK